jgi:hypothetical protein
MHTTLTQSRQRKLWQTLQLLVLMLVSASYAFPQFQSGSSREIEEITELEQRRAAAVVHRDTDFLDKVTATDSVRILPTGIFETKLQLLSQLKSGALTSSSIDVDHLSVKTYGQTAGVTGRSVFKGQRDGKPFDGRCEFSRVWLKKHGGWQEVLFQLTPIREP